MKQKLESTKVQRLVLGTAVATQIPPRTRGTHM